MSKKERHDATSETTWRKEYPLDGRLDEDQVWRLDILPQLDVLPDNVRNIWSYGVTEMLNNAIDHSEGSFVSVTILKDAVRHEIVIQDDGVGIFKKIQSAFDLVDENYAVLELAKGKLTTDVQRHSGEGIFFTSRSVDTFAILSGTVHFLHQGNQAEDYIFGRDYFGNKHKGTTVMLTLANDSTRTTKEVFAMYTTEHDGGFGFDKTIVPVRLALHGDEMLVSRSQAKRLLNRFDRFRIVVLDFEGVCEIGQAFADEVFRVFPNFHPTTEICAVNANDWVQKMITRAKDADVK